MSTKEQIAASIVTARADLEQALDDLGKLPALDWGTFRYINHTLGNYLNITAACVHLLGVDLADHPDPEVHLSLETLERTTDLMTQLQRNLTNASATTETPLAREKVDLGRMVTRASSFYSRVAEQKQIQFLREAEPPAALAWADRIAVATVLDNLLSNAVKYSPPDKRVWVKVTAEPGHVVCTVRDEGPGLTPADQARLFQRGARLGNVPTGGEESTGYGLAIAKDLLDRLGGTIWCESQPGQGASFSFRLPAHSEQPPAPPQ